MDNNYTSGKKLLCGGYSQYTPTGKSYFVKAGRFGREPQLGSIVYFYSDKVDKGRVCHVGGVIKVKKDGDWYTIKVSEGNTSSGAFFNRNGGCVTIKEYTFTLKDVGGKNRINGFGYPMFGEDTCSIEEFIEILKGEDGYIEKASNHQLDDKTANPGNKNFTKYGEWYGCNGVYWCQQYISWCAYKACKKHKVKSKTGWIETTTGWKYRLGGEFIKNEWREIGERWYVFDSDGNAINGWFKSEDSWYFLNRDDSAMLSSQWVEDNSKWYYLTKTGEMAMNAYVKNKTKDIYHFLGITGEWNKSNDTAEPDLGKYELVI